MLTETFAYSPTFSPRQKASSAASSAPQQPLVRRLVVELPCPLRPGHHVEVVEVVAMNGRAGVIAARHQRHVAILDRQRLVEERSSV